MKCNGKDKPQREVNPSEFNFHDLKETGRLQFFYHSPSSSLPVRDVLNEQRHGYKTEPHIEKKAENYCCKCIQPNIIAFLKSSAKYLLLYTRCKSGTTKHKNGMYVVGHIVKEKYEDRGGFYAVKGETTLYSFSDAYPVKYLTSARNARHVPKKIDERLTKRVLDSFEGKMCILPDSVKEVERLKKLLPESECKKQEKRCR